MVADTSRQACIVYSALPKRWIDAEISFLGAYYRACGRQRSEFRDELSNSRYRGSVPPAATLTCGNLAHCVPVVYRIVFEFGNFCYRVEFSFLIYAETSLYFGGVRLTCSDRVGNVWIERLLIDGFSNCGLGFLDKGSHIILGLKQIKINNTMNFTWIILCT